MTEKLFQFIWQYRYFHTGQLRTFEGEELEILHQGSLNTGQGPDFSNAKIRVGATIWVGNIELHIRSSDWFRHHHQNDAHYENVILHVVWEHDAKKELPFPTLELSGRISYLMLDTYRQWQQKPTFIPCEGTLRMPNTVVVSHWMHRLLLERLESRTQIIYEQLRKALGNWEEVYWWKLAAVFGSMSNSDAFETIARSIPVNLLRRNRFSLLQLEALLMGQAALLDTDFQDEHPRLLKKEYTHLARKYSLSPPGIVLHFLRMRPAAFPTVRLAQLAAVILQAPHGLNGILLCTDPDRIRKMFETRAGDYWTHHYLPDEPSPAREKRVGEVMIDNIMLNAVLPMLFAHAHFHGRIYEKEEVLRMLQKMKPENNEITLSFRQLGFNPDSAFDTQALLQMKKEYCEHSRCLECAIGSSILKSN